MVNLQGRWAFITGASRGIGYLSAKFLASHGCNLILHGRKPIHCETILREAREAGVEAYVVAAELSDSDQVTNMLRQIDKLGVRVDVVLNNAGLQVGYREDFFATPVSDYATSFAVNTIAPMMICYHFMPKMIAAGFGRIVNTTSGIRLEPQQAGYSASKAALDKVTVDLGKIVEGTDVSINLADPGWCRTDLGGTQAPNEPESTIPGILVGALIDDKKSGRWFGAQDFAGMTPEDAVKKAEAEFDSPYAKE